MLRGLYEFRPINEKTLGFQMNDLLLFLEPHARDKNWLRVADGNGHIGFVPINFIEIHRETSSEKLLGFLDEAIRRARRDRLSTVDLLGSVRQNIMTSPYTTEEHMVQIEREVVELRARAISELNYEEDCSRRYNKPKEKHSSPRQSGVESSRSPGHPPPQSNRHHHQNYNLHTHQQNPSFFPLAHRHAHHHFHDHDPEPDPSGELINQIPNLDPMPLLDSPFLILPGAEIDQLKSLQQQQKCRKKHKKQPDSCSSQNQTQYAEIQVIPSHNTQNTQIIQNIQGNGKLVGEYVQGPLINPLTIPPIGVCDEMAQSPLQKKSQDKDKTSSSVPDSFITSIGRRCSQQHCQRSMEHNCCCSPTSKTSCGMGRMRPPGSPLDTVTMAAEIVDIVRNATGLSHKLSQDATEVVLQYVCENIGGMPDELMKLLIHLDTPRAVSQNPGVISRSPDAHNIRKIFNRLTQCKEDEQQRSWALHEDEAMILENLEHLHTILNKADASISKYVMQSDRYNSVNALVLYYQMETRWSIREKLVDCFGMMCTIDEQALSVLVNSILPMELAREIQGNKGNSDRMCMCAGLLVMLLSCGENMPITHYDHLGADFLEFVFNVIEDPPNQDEKITDGFMNLLFAYNLQFNSVENNLIVSTLGGRSNASVFTQKVIYFLNREVDPIDMFEHLRNAPNSVLKLTIDTFHSKKAADLFYTNDIKVLIDIVTRCVTDLGPGDLRRTSYLKLVRVIVRNSNFVEHKHRLEDLQNCFMSIMLEEDHLAVKDQNIIKKIATEFPQFFKTDG